MNLGQQILFFFSALGVFNGFTISVYLLLFRKLKTPAAQYLGLLLLMLSIRITKSIFLYFYPALPQIYIQIGLSGCFLIGPSLFYFIRAALANPISKTINWTRSYLFWVALIVLTGVLFPYSSYPLPWKTYIPKLIYLQWTAFIFLSGWQIRKLIPKLFASTEKLSTTEKSVVSIFGGVLIVHIAFVLAMMGFFKTMYISGGLFFSLMLYLNIPLFINRKKDNTIFPGKKDQDRESYQYRERYADKKISHDQASLLTAKLQQLILEQKLYKNPDLKLNDLARKVNISGHQLSQLLNDNLDKSFATYINKYRIDESCQMIKHNKTIKLEEIGYEVGFNSKSTFYAAFKKHMNTTPTLYKEAL